MDNYAIAADISDYLINLLKTYCAPAPVYSVDRIGFASQGSSSDFVLSLFLYDISPMNKGVFAENTFPLCLKYFITANSQGQPDIKAAEELRILGAAISAFANNPVIDRNIIHNNDTPACIYMDNLSLDEKIKILSHVNITKSAVFYYVSPVLIGLKTEKPAARVRSTR